VNSDLASELPRALQRNEIVPYYQPIVDLQTRRIVAFEVLARWHRAPHQIINPLEFIPLAEKAGLIGDLTERLLRGACLAAVDWPADIQLSLNISPLLLQDAAMPDRLHRIAGEARFPFRRLVFEITESAEVKDFDTAGSILGNLRSLGPHRLIS